MKVGIIGYGFVGKALHQGILLDSKDIFLVDPLLNTNVKDLKLFQPDIVFICVPTPMEDNGKQDISIVNSVLIDIKKYLDNPIITLKSTILPNHLENLSKGINEFIYNPEFLREKTANYDFINSKLIIFGGSEVYTKKLANFYKFYTKCIHQEYIFTDLMTSSLVKYSINSFLALKVTFFNELYELYSSKNSKLSWKSFISIIQLDERIGSSHMDVPGHDERKGFGGACLPKDSSALVQFSIDSNQPMTLLEKAIKINNNTRSKYIIGTDREKVQNIKFSTDD